MKTIGPTFSDFVTSGKIKKKQQGAQIVNRDVRMLFPMILLAVVLTVLFARLFYLQIIQGSYYSMLSDQNRTRSVLVPAPRGIIFDRNGRPLVSNSPAFEILINNKATWVNKTTALEMMAQGKNVISTAQRDYLFNSAFAHVIGYVGQVSPDELLLPQFADYAVADFNGKIGLEEEYEGLLHGTDGKKLYEVDAQGRQVRFLGQQDPIPGQNITTTLDLNIQQDVVAAMKGVKKGAVVVSDPNTGGILALYSKPSFDPNLFTHDNHYTPTGNYKSVTQILMDTSNQPLLDRAISGVYPPGSTYKLVTATAGLETGSITPSTQILDTGFIKLGGLVFNNWYYTGYGKTDGEVDVVKAIKRSNDIFFYRTAQRTGINKMDIWSKIFGLGNPLGIDIPGEAGGTVPNPAWKQKVIGQPWFTGDIFNMGIGQGYLLVTPLQDNFWTLPFANGGTLYRPHLLKGHISVIKKNFIKPEYMSLIRKGMLEACETGGVGWPLFNFEVRNPHLPNDGADFTRVASASAGTTAVAVGCKTGTAQVGGATTQPDAWMTAFAPFYHPQIVVTVLVENAGEGSNVAGPIIKDIFTKYFEAEK